MNLRVKITGLCLIVPETLTGGRTVYHVLMPATGGHGGSHVHPHRPTLSYKGAERPYDLECAYLDLTFISGTVGTADLSPVIHVGNLVGKGVPGTLLRPGAGPEAAALVTLPPPSQVMHGDKARWVVANADCEPVDEPEERTHHIEWIVNDISPTTLELTLQRIRANCAEPPALPPPNPHGNEFCLSLVNLPVAETTQVPVGTCAPHFPAYFRVFNLHPPATPNLRLASPPPTRTPPSSELQCKDAPLQILDDEAESAFNCMLAQASV
jgi:hypothetical protein